MSQFKAGIVVAVLVLSGCAWQRIPPPPHYSASAPLPIRVGIVLDHTQASTQYGPEVAGLWKGMGLFESVTYPYRDGDSVDGVLKLSIDGGWRGKGAASGVLIGLTLGLASTATGPSMTGVHDAVATLSKGGREVARYSTHVESTITWGLQANTTEVGNKADDLQRRKLAVEIAQKLETDRVQITKIFTK